MKRAFGAIRFWLLALGVMLASWQAPRSAAADCSDPPGDVTGDGIANVVDVQCDIVTVLWFLGGQSGSAPTCVVPDVAAANLNCDDEYTVADVLLGINYTLEIALSSQTDSNGNSCPDLCESDFDSDSDGSPNGVDCEPTNADVYPGAAELCNGIDDDCSGGVDDADIETMCGDGTTCTTDACVEGACENVPVDCSDGDACTSDACTDVYPDCPNGVGYAGTCLQAVSGSLTWQNASSACQAAGGHLAVIQSDAENAAAFDAIALGCGAGTGAWIGLNDIDEEGTFVWVNGEPFTYSAWGGVEPNNSGNEDVVHIRGDGLWNDQKTSNSQPCYVCEFEGQGTAEAECISSAKCDDQNACTTDSCDPADGTCTNDAIDCTDTDICTTDSCDPATGCKNEAITCNDDKACTTDACVVSELDCPSGTLLDGVCYTGHLDPLTWTQAVAACQSLGAELVAIHSDEQNDAVRLAADLGCGGGTAWIGLTDELVEGSFGWVNGDPLDYTNWASNEPNDLNGEDYVKITGSGTWNDSGTGTTACYVCANFPTSVGSTCENTYANCDDGDACTADGCLEASPTCCTKTSGKGCSADPVCEDCVCALDAFCCNTGWDNICRDEAQNECASACGCDIPLGTCISKAVTCEEDSNLCTKAVCDSIAGCELQVTDCDDGDACTADACDPDTGGCVNEALDCDDGSMCTTDSCDQATGCSHVSEGCDDGSACTLDTCDDATGCIYEPISGACSDSDNCTADACEVDTSALNCDATLGSSCYSVATDAGNLNWVNANAYCEGLGGHLPSVHSEAENELLFDLGLATCASSSFLWLGFNDLAVDDLFEWTSGQPATYTNWAQAEPSNTNGDEFYTQLYLTGSSVGMWNDQWIGAKSICTICEFTAPSACTHAQDNSVCDDGDPCSMDTCDPASQNCTFALVDCDDGNPCTDDMCDTATGDCASTPNADPCDDGFTCTDSACGVPVVSVATCDELGWNATLRGSADVCGESDDGGPLGPCSGLVTWDDAFAFCDQAGARLCTAVELANDEARGTGCGYDDDLIWTSTPCPSGAILTVVGNSSHAPNKPSICVAPTDTRYARCCADAAPASVGAMCLPTQASQSVEIDGECYAAGSGANR